MNRTPQNTAIEIHTALVERGFRASRDLLSQGSATYRHLATGERVKVKMNGIHAHIIHTGKGMGTTGNISPLVDLDIDTQIANWIKATR